MNDVNVERMYRYGAALGRDRWITWCWANGLTLLIISWFGSEKAADILLALAVACVAVAVLRAVYVSVQVHRGRASQLRNARGEQIARKADGLVSVAFFVVAVVLIVWNYVK